MPKAKASPENVIRRTVDYIPDCYKNHRQFASCLQALERGDWAAVLDALVALAEDSGHYFSEDSWRELAAVATALELHEQASRCERQVERNQNEIGWETPFGWTTVKIDDTHYQHHISEKLKEKQAARRRKEDRVEELSRRDGIYLKMHGRCGTAYIVYQGKLAEIGCELGMAGLVLYFSATESWSLPSKQPLTSEERAAMHDAILDWAHRAMGPIELL
jgi:hypothetical protein